MKKLYFLLFTFLISVASIGQTTVFINEIHYDNSGTDTNEGVEIAGPAGTDLALTLLHLITVMEVLLILQQQQRELFLMKALDMVPFL